MRLHRDKDSGVVNPFRTCKGTQLRHARSVIILQLSIPEVAACWLRAGMYLTARFLPQRYLPWTSEQPPLSPHHAGAGRVQEQPCAAASTHRPLDSEAPAAALHQTPPTSGLLRKGPLLPALVDLTFRHPDSFPFPTTRIFSSTSPPHLCMPDRSRCVFRISLAHRLLCPASLPAPI